MSQSRRVRTILGGVVFVAAVVAFAVGVTGSRAIDLLVLVGGAVLAVLIGATKAVCPSCGKRHWMIRGTLGHCMACGASFESSGG